MGTGDGENYQQFYVLSERDRAGVGRSQPTAREPRGALLLEHHPAKS